MTEPRLQPLTAQERTPEQQRLIDRAGGELRVFTTLARHPGLFDDFQHLGGRLLHRSALSEREREILILRTAFGCRADYEWAQHHRIATALGLESDVIAALGQPTPALSAADALLARAADELVSEHHLSDASWHALSERFSEVQLIELCMLVGSYAMLAGTLNSMQVQPEPGLAVPPWAQDCPLWALVLLTILGCYGLKLVGYLLPARVLEHRRTRRVVELLPVALLAALVVVQAVAVGKNLDLNAARLIGFAVGAVAIWRRAPFLVIVVLAAATTALLRLAFGLS